jgi:flagellar basal-body rod protein FlgB
MGPNGLFGSTLTMLERVMDLRSRRHTILSANIVNQETPHYKAFDIAMSEELARIGDGARTDAELDRTDRRHLNLSGSPSADRHYQLKALHPQLAKRDGNTVDVDLTMADLAENTLMYNALTRIISKRLSGLKNAIKGGA